MSGYAAALTPRMALCGDGCSRKSLRFNEVMGEGCADNISPLKRGSRDHTHTPRKGQVRASERAAVYKPGRDLAQKLSDFKNFKLPDLRGNTFLLFKPWGLWYFVTVP